MQGAAAANNTRGRGQKLGLALLWLTGCCNSYDVSKRAPYLIGYRPGTTYRLNHEAVLVKGGDEYSMLLERDTPPKSRIVERVSPGTTFTIDRLVRTDCSPPIPIPIQGEYYVDTLGSIVGGPLEGLPVALRLSSVAWIPSGPWKASASLSVPDEEYVEEVGAADTPE